jgi:hypothetical protein
MKYTNEGALYLVNYPWDREFRLQFGPQGMGKGDTGTWVKVADHTLTYEVSESIDLVTPQVDAIKAQMEELRAKSEAALTQMQEQINSLLAIEHKVTA